MSRYTDKRATFEGCIELATEALGRAVTASATHSGQAHVWFARAMGLQSLAAHHDTASRKGQP